MKGLATCVLTLICISIGAQNYNWGFSVGSVNYDNAFAVETDNSGNHIVFGRYGGTMDFDPGSSSAILTPVGSDIFVAKYATDGSLIWVKNIECSGSHTPFCVEVDSDNNIVLGGSYGGTIDFDPGIGVQSSTSAGSDDMFILKLDENGEYIWHYTAGSTNDQRINEIAIDSNNDVVATGFISVASVDFDPGPGTSILTPVNTDIVVVKLNSTGVFQFAKIFTGNGTSYGYGIDTDAMNNIYTTGNLGGNVDFDPGIGTYTLSNIGTANCFISKIDANGNFVWAKGIHNNGSVVGRGIKVDNNQNIILSGLYNTTADFDLGPGIHNMTAVGSNNAYLLKLDNGGNFLWAKSVEASGGSSSNFNIDVSTSNNQIALIGVYSGNIDLGDPGNTIPYPAVAGNDCYFAIYDENGNYQFGHAFGGVNLDYLYGVDYTGTELLVCGYYQTSITDVDPSPATETFNAVGGEDFFLIKYSTCSDNGSSQTISACDSYTWPTNGNTYTSSGVYTETLTNVDGCDSVVTLNLTINPIYFEVDVVTACDNYIWSVNGNTYSSSGIYSEIFSSVDGCDSSHVLNLTINNSELTTETISACDSYTWPVNGVTYSTSGIYSETYTNMNGCDSVVTLNLTVNNSYNNSESVSICNSENYQLPDGSFVNTAGIYTSNLTSINGCDSIIETTINVITPNVATTLSGLNLSADAVSANYQWLRCPDYSLLVGETNQTLVLTENGSYAVIVEENGCVDTSDCVVIDFIGYDEYDNLSVLVYPNPASNKIQIKSQNLPIHFIEFYDATGKKVFITTQIDDIIFDLPTGIYQIHIYTTTGEKIMTNLAIVN